MLPAILILTGFATLWACTGLAAAHLPPIAFAGPVAFSALLLLWGIPRVRGVGRNVPNARRIVLLWSGVEVAAMFVAINLLPRFGMMDAVAPVFAMIVGAHFLPLAHYLRVQSYYVTGVALIGAGLAGLAFPFPDRVIIVGAVCAAILWTCAAYIARRAGARRAG